VCDINDMSGKILSNGFEFCHEFVRRVKEFLFSREKLVGHKSSKALWGRDVKAMALRVGLTT